MTAVEGSGFYCVSLKYNDIYLWLEVRPGHSAVNVRIFFYNGNSLKKIKKSVFWFKRAIHLKLII